MVFSTWSHRRRFLSGGLGLRRTRARSGVLARVRARMLLELFRCSFLLNRQPTGSQQSTIGTAGYIQPSSLALLAPAADKLGDLPRSCLSESSQPGIDGMPISRRSARGPLAYSLIKSVCFCRVNLFQLLLSPKRRAIQGWWLAPLEKIDRC